ncbi:TPA: hypothetical protein O8382_002905 [Staphylococcus aureus]|uniref:hypothetical protein n=1 Tax=Staphylococcus hominis TaxID=1290 RepID=UPI00119E9E2F|nr:hypothetical protein [Staphylococcus hominis]HDC5913483.1 hypothetical protein [Staphylococcus aureus]HDC5913742.1 hypothetical protein [Staphylococcus aureus]
MLTDFFNEILAFIIYWFLGWGILLIGIALIIWIVVRNIKSTKYKENIEKIFTIFTLIVIATLTAVLFKSITNYAIDIDPNRMTEEEKKTEKQLEQMGE